MISCYRARASLSISLPPVLPPRACVFTISVLLLPRVESALATTGGSYHRGVGEATSFSARRIGSSIAPSHRGPEGTRERRSTGLLGQHRTRPQKTSQPASERHASDPNQSAVNLEIVSRVARSGVGARFTRPEFPISPRGPKGSRRPRARPRARASTLLLPLHARTTGEHESGFMNPRDLGKTMAEVGGRNIPETCPGRFDTPWHGVSKSRRNSRLV